MEFPAQIPIDNKGEQVTFIGEKTLGKGTKNVTVYMPLYNGVNDLQIGIQKGYFFKPIKPYKNKPIVFYGSSITQGACATHAGNDYVHLISRALNVDVINLGFAGSAQGEKAMAEYISNLDVSAVVLDYDHNAPTVEHLQKTHAPFYQIIRNAKRDLPIIFMTRPIVGYYKDALARKSIVYKTYEQAHKAGENVEFIAGEEFFDETDESVCNADTCHPNDTGFYFMAKKLIPILKAKLF